MLIGTGYSYAVSGTFNIFFNQILIVNYLTVANNWYKMILICDELITAN
jgi:hypothetical protein